MGGSEQRSADDSGSTTPSASPESLFQMAKMECAASLIKRCKDVNLPDRLGHSPLRIACEKGELEIVKLLLASPTIQLDHRTAEDVSPSTDGAAAAKSPFPPAAGGGGVGTGTAVPSTEVSSLPIPPPPGPFGSAVNVGASAAFGGNVFGRFLRTAMIDSTPTQLYSTQLYSTLILYLYLFHAHIFAPLYPSTSGAPGGTAPAVGAFGFGRFMCTTMIHNTSTKAIINNSYLVSYITSTLISSPPCILPSSGAPGGTATAVGAFGFGRFMCTTMIDITLTNAIIKNPYLVSTSLPLSYLPRFCILLFRAVLSLYTLTDDNGRDNQTRDDLVIW